MKTRLHLHRYGGRVLCGRDIDEVWHTAGDILFQNSPNACRSCDRARVVDDEREMQAQREPG